MAPPPAKDDWYRFAVVLKDTDTLAGTVLIDYEDEVEGWEIVGRYAKENPRSGNVMRKLGFRYEKDIPHVCSHGTVGGSGAAWR